MTTVARQTSGRAHAETRERVGALCWCSPASHSPEGLILTAGVCKRQRLRERKTEEGSLAIARASAEIHRRVATPGLGFGHSPWATSCVPPPPPLALTDDIYEVRTTEHQPPTRQPANHRGAGLRRSRATCASGEPDEDCTRASCPDAGASSLASAPTSAPHPPAPASADDRSRGGERARERPARCRRGLPPDAQGSPGRRPVGAGLRWVGGRPTWGHSSYRVRGGSRCTRASRAGVGAGLRGRGVASRFPLAPSGARVGPDRRA